VETLTVDGKLESLSAIAQYVMTAAATAGLDKKAAYRLRLAVDEIATNIILHGYEEAGLTGTVEISAEIQDQHLKLLLEDGAIAYDPTIEHQAPQDLNLPLADRPIGGLGVFLALDGVDRFAYEYVNGHNRNILVVNLP
jgi:serine/threonine-protein kinase RsbW